MARNCSEHGGECRVPESRPARPINCVEPGDEIRESDSKEQNQGLENSEETINLIHMEGKEERLTRSHKQVIIGGVGMVALLDSGAALNTLRLNYWEGIYDRWSGANGDLRIFPQVGSLQGFGGAMVRSAGRVKLSPELDGAEYLLEYVVVRRNASNKAMIIGDPLRNLARVVLEPNQVVVEPLFDPAYIQMIQEEADGVEKLLGRVHVNYREEVQSLVRRYRPEAKQEVPIQIKIYLKNEEPICCRPRRPCIAEKRGIKTQIEEWLREEIIVESTSEFSSAVLVQQKKDGRAQICIDYKPLNRLTLKEQMPMPIVEDVLDDLAGAKVFSALDFKDGFFHVKVAPESRKYTAFVMSTESEDSDVEGGLGNINKLIIRPPDHSGKAKKGHLCFDASFETGNLGRVDLVSEYEYDLFIRPDTCSPRLRLWFNFTVDNVRQDQRVIFNIVNFSKSKNLFRDGMTPLVRSTSRSKWQRLPLKQVFYYKSTQNQNHYVLSFAFAFDRENELYQFALTYPYSYTRYLGHLENLILRYPIVKRETLANSIQNRKIELLTITTEETFSAVSLCSNEYEHKSQRAVVIFGRVHPGESPSSFICQGLMDFLVSAHPIAKILRDYVVFKVIPMLNPDGVYFGNYRSTLLGMDLNRSWNRISKWIHPTLIACRILLESLNKNPKIPLDCILDLHAHSNATGVFVYGNSYDDIYRYERHIVFPKFLAQLAEDYETNNTMYNQDNRKEGTSRRFLCSVLNEHVNCYTLQVSMYGYTRKGTTEILPYTEESYYRVGRNLARALLEYYKLMGLIPSGLPNQPSNKRSRYSYQYRRVPREPRPITGRKPAPLHLTSIHDYFRVQHEKKEPPGVTVPKQQRQHYRSISSICMNSESIVTNTRNKIHQLNSEPKCISHRFCSSEPDNQVYPQKEITITAGINKKPSLTIIDFNQLTRGGLDLATKRNTVKVTSQRLSPKRRACVTKRI